METQVEATFDYEWFWKCRLPDRKGQHCRVLIRAKKMNSIMVEFEDGYQVITSRYAVRKRKDIEKND